MLLYPNFYRLKGVRRVDKIITPPLSFVKEFDLPRMSAVHYIPPGLEMGPDSKWWMLNGATRGAWVDHVVSLSTLEGNPRYVPSGVLTDIREYSRAHPLLRRLLKPVDSLKDGNYPLVVNYGLLQRAYVYRSNIYARYYEWANVFNTLVSKVNEIAAVSPRQQFIVIELPDEIPSIAQFMHADSKFDQTALRAFRTPQLWALLDIWKWLGTERHESCLGGLNDVGLEHLNIIWTRRNMMTVQNLGLLNDWRFDPNATDNTGSGQKVDMDKLQKRFLRFWLTFGDADVQSEVVSDDEIIEAIKPGITASKGKPIVDDSASGDDIFLDKDADEINDGDDHVGGKDQIDSETQDILNVHEQHSSTDDVDGRVLDLSEVPPYKPVDITLENGITVKTKRALEQGAITLAEANRFQTLAARHAQIVLPETNQPIAEFMRVTPEMVAIDTPPRLPDIESVIDKSMLQSTLLDMDSRYIKDILPRDIAGSIMSIQQAGVAVTDIKVEEHQDISSHYRTYIISLQPVNGKQSTVRAKVPVVQEDGTVLSGGVKYYLKKQRGEMPIRKTSPSRVALTSYYGKVFIDRNQNVAVNYDHWLGNQITMLGLDRESETVTDMRVGASFDSTVALPRTYTALAKRFTSFTAAGIHFNFVYANRTAVHGGTELLTSHLEKLHKATLIGKSDTATVLMRDDNTLVSTSRSYNRTDGPVITELGTIEDLLGLPSMKRPVEMATMTVFSENIPLAIVLGYRLGLSTLMSTLGVTPRRVENGKQLNLTADEFRVRFKDQSLIFSRKDPKAALILSGLNARHRSIVRYDLAQFDKPDVYFNILDEAGLGVRYTRELDVMFDLFIDSITRELLVTMNEPTDLTLLVLRAVELLSSDYFNEEEGIREKGYERIAGAVYNQLIRSYRAKQAKPFSNRSGVEVNPEAVWLSIMMDSAMEVVSEINPIHNLKNKEVVTFGGTGGRSTKTMVKRTRAFRKNDLGVISEATVDSGDVGIITYLSADPKYVSLRGIRGTYDEAVDGKTRLISTSALLAPSADNDDPKRTNFISIQNSHSVPCEKYVAPPLTTGYGDVIAHRTDDLFATTAKQAGKVITKTDTAIVVLFEDGTSKSVELGRRYGKSAGSIVPHRVITDLQLGDTVAPGQAIAWNSMFFAKSPLDPTALRYKSGLMVNTAIMDGADTHEDSSAISKEIAELFSTDITYVRYLVLNFDQRVSNMVTEGTQIEADGILCTIQDSVSAGAGLFDEDTIQTLQSLADATPKAKHQGRVERIECIYNGDIDTMDESLKSLAQTSDRRMSKLSNSLGKARLTGKVDGTYRIEGKPLQPNQIAIAVYITNGVAAGVGDKAVFGNQLKTIFGRVMSGVNRTESGIPVDAIFSYSSISNRIVMSPEIMGTTNTLLRVISKRAVSIYKG